MARETHHVLSQHRGDDIQIHLSAGAQQTMRRVFDDIKIESLFLRPHNHGVSCSRDRRTQQELLMEFFSRPQTDVLQIDLLAEHIVTLHIVSAETDHALGEVHNFYRLSHIEHQDITTRTQGTRLQNELGSLTNTHEVTGYFWMCDRHGTTAADLLSKQRDNGPR